MDSKAFASPYFVKAYFEAVKFEGNSSVVVFISDEGFETLFSSIPFRHGRIDI